MERLKSRSDARSAPTGKFASSKKLMDVLRGKEPIPRLLSTGGTSEGRVNGRVLFGEGGTNAGERIGMV